MKVDFGGRSWELDLTDIDLKPAMVIQGYMGMSLRQWGECLQDDEVPDPDENGNPVLDDEGRVRTKVLSAADKPEFLRSLAAVYWLMLAQNGETCPIADVDFKVGAFADAVFDAMAAELEAELEAEQARQAREPEPDPTLPPVVSAPSPEPSSPSPPGTGDAGTPDG